MIHNTENFQIDANIQVFPCDKIAFGAFRYARAAHNPALRVAAILKIHKTADIWYVYFDFVRLIVDSGRESHVTRIHTIIVGSIIVMESSSRKYMTFT